MAAGSASPDRATLDFAFDHDEGKLSTEARSGHVRTGTLGSGERATVTVIVRPMTNVASLSNAAEVSGAVTDPNPANNKEVEETTVVTGR